MPSLIPRPSPEKDAEPYTSTKIENPKARAMFETFPVPKKQLPYSAAPPHHAIKHQRVQQVDSP